MPKFIAKKALIFIVSVSSLAVLADEATEQSRYLDQSRLTAQAFMKALGSTLKSQLETADAASAISVCKHVAPALAADYSKNDWEVKRVSLKARNNALGVPDTWERETLESFETRYRNGESAAHIETSAIVETADGRWYRYLKAIPTQQMCLQCHGQPTDMSAQVKAILSKEYPDDHAIGYQAGEIRGAVSIKRRLDDKEDLPE